MKRREGETGEKSGRSLMGGRVMEHKYKIFRNEFKTVHFAQLENKTTCPHPMCEKAVFFQRTGL